VADKITQQITDALTRAAANPNGLPLYGSKSDPGLFPNTAGVKPAAQKCLADGLVRAIGTDAKGKTPRDLYALTDPGWEFLLAQVNPKQVLEDFVRVLEAQQGEVGELLDTARRMADSLQGLKDAVARVLPNVSVGRVVAPVSRGPLAASRAPPEAASGPRLMAQEDSVALLESPSQTDLAPTILARLADWSGAAGEDCPLPELFRSLSLLDPPPTIGEFHDCLRRLHADGSLYLHPWTGPLYALPEPAYALLVGHNVAYYASLRRGQKSEVRNQKSDLADL
jgi:DNA-binding PadR family transcriptional regulator